MKDIQDQLAGYLRQYRHNDNSGLVMGYEKDGIDDLVECLQAELKRQQEENERLLFANRYNADMYRQIDDERKRLQAEVERLQRELTCLDRYNDKLEQENDRLADERDQLKAQINGMKQAIDDLVRNSEGVAGLHQNGNVAPWDELLTGGRFEEWLAVFDDTPEQSLAAHDAEVIEQFACELGVFDPEYDDQEYIEVPRHTIKDYANQLRQQAKESSDA